MEQCTTDTPPPITPLRAIRLARKLTLTELAAQVGISKSTLSRYEQDQQTPNRDDARALYLYFEGRIKIQDIYDPFFNADKKSRGEAGRS